MAPRRTRSSCGPRPARCGGYRPITISRSRLACRAGLSHAGWMRAYLLIACVLPLLTASLPAAALDEDCGRVPSTAGREGDPFASYLPTIDSALSLPKEGVFALHLRPASEVIYLV